jgi:hypothetical protein
MGLSRDELVQVALRHANAEAENDLATTLATLEPEPVYDFFPVGRRFVGMAATRAYYDHLFSTFLPMVSSYELISEFVNNDGVAQEYMIHVRLPDGSEEHHRVLGILTFGTEALSGERIYGSDRLLELMVGPALAMTQPI